MNTINVDLDLVRKYCVPGPRYTSYPPATQFTDQISKQQLLERIRLQQDCDRPLSLYFHLPFCRSLCWFCGCTTVITTQQKKSAKYLEYLKKEIELMAGLLDGKREAVQIHFGGGTPTFLLPEEIRTLGKLIHSHFKVARDVEAGVEIDPRTVSQEHLQALREIGFNRASIGVQDNNPEVQQAVHRIQPAELTEKVVRWIRESGIDSLNIDLIYGLPRQTPESFAKTLDEIIALAPDRLAVFSYAHVPWIKPSQRVFKEEEMPSAEIKLKILKLTVEKLTSEGYVNIGMDHFARENDELAVAQRNKNLQRNFQGYSTRAGTDLYAFGMSSISQGDGIYWQNQKDLLTYCDALDHGDSPIAKGYILNDDDKIRRETIMRLMCDLGLEFDAMSKNLGIDFPQYFNTELASLADLEADGLVELSQDRLSVTDLGRLLIRNIAMKFDAHLPKNSEKRFSKTV